MNTPPPPRLPVPAIPPLPGHAQRLQAALAALNASRAVLRAALIEPPEAPLTAAERAAGGRSPWRHPWRSLRRLVRRWPVADLAAQALRGWWRSHPWRATCDLVVGGLVSEVQPLVRRHPVATVAGAAALGALVVAGRPWRWPVVGDQLRPLPNRVAHWLLGQLTSVPVQTALASLLLMALRDQPPAEEPAADGAAQQPGPATSDTAGVFP